MTPEEENKALKKIILSFGDATANVIEQMLKGDWRDDHGHSVKHNLAMSELGLSLMAATKHAEENGAY